MVDEILFKKVKNGDIKSFAKLIEPIKDKLYKAAFIYIGNEDDALDCIHDSVIKAIRSIDSIKEPKYFNTWMTRIVINTSKNFVKRNNKTILVDMKDYESKLIVKQESFEENDELYTAVDKLSDKEKELIILRYIEDRSLKDISSQKNMPLGSVKSGLNRSLKKLKLILGGVN